MAAQCDVDQAEVLTSPVVAWLREAALEDFAVVFAALGVDTVPELAHSPHRTRL